MDYATDPTFYGNQKQPLNITSFMSQIQNVSHFVWSNYFRDLTNRPIFSPNGGEL